MQKKKEGQWVTRQYLLTQRGWTKQLSLSLFLQLCSHAHPCTCYMAFGVPNHAKGDGRPSMAMGQTEESVEAKHDPR